MIVDAFATTFTNAEGNFIFKGLPTIDYKIVIEHVGYDAYTSEDFTVIVDDTPDLKTIVLVPTV